ncbi:MAG: hypothetical protein ACYTEQ_04985, partial [Planctomycetota bacterium]
MRRVVISAGFMSVWMLYAAGLCCGASTGGLSAAKERVRNKIEFMRAEIAYLEGEHAPQEKKWRKYKRDVDSLVRVCERTMSSWEGDEQGALERLQEMERDLERLNARIPLRLPSGPKGAGRFGAYYQTLKFSLAWDKFWKISRHADVVVRFDEFDHRFVFWRGTSYIPHWATYDG